MHIVLLAAGLGARFFCQPGKVLQDIICCPVLLGINLFRCEWGQRALEDLDVSFADQCIILRVARLQYVVLLRSFVLVPSHPRCLFTNFVSLRHGIGYELIHLRSLN